MQVHFGRILLPTHIDPKERLNQPPNVFSQKMTADDLVREARKNKRPAILARRQDIYFHKSNTDYTGKLTMQEEDWIKKLRNKWVTFIPWIPSEYTYYAVLDEDALALEKLFSQSILDNTNLDAYAATPQGELIFNNFLEEWKKKNTIKKIKYWDKM